MRTVEAELDAGYGVYTGRDLKVASLLFSPTAARWVANEQWHAKQELQTLADGSLRMRLPYADDTELLMDLMRQGAEVKVESPADLRRKLVERLQAAAAQYGK
jgi:predicted DNA-binding transcriptional regulator YafY